MESNDRGAGVAGATDAVRHALAAECRASAARVRATYAVWQECLHQHMVDRDRPDPSLEDLGGVRAPSHAVLDPWDLARDELVVALGVHSGRAAALLELAVTMVERYPLFLGAVEAGRMDERTACMLARHLSMVDAGVLETVQRDYLAWYLGSLDAGIRPGRRAQCEMLDRIVGEVDPDGVRARRVRARRGRTVVLRPAADGMCDVGAVLGAEEAACLVERLDQMVRETDESPGDLGTPPAPDASGVTGPGTATGDDSTPPSHGERRADALMALVMGGARTSDGTATSRSAPAVTPAVIRPRISVIAPVLPDRHPTVVVARSGAASLEALRSLLSRCDGATVELVDPTPGAGDHPALERKYRIPADLARRIRLRDGTCRFPGCSVSADHCDIDHVVPFDHIDPARGGPTAERNLV